MNSRINFYIILIILTTLCGCANQTSPTGGPKDEEPPVLFSSTPAIGQKNFQGDRVVLTFNEYIKTDKANEQIIITPRLDQEYEIKYRKDKVIIEFEKPLKDSTTYSINFREAIKDITEGNPADTLILAFSTGPYLDSLSISGTIKELMTNAPADDITVSLYNAHDTLNVFNSPPVYLTKTNEEGFYQLRNIKNSQYRIYALNDKNKNLMLDSKSEANGFRSAILPLDTNLNELNIPIQSMDVRPFELQSDRQSGTTYNIKYNKYVLDYSIYNDDSTHALFSNIEPGTHNTVQVYNINVPADSLKAYISATDSTHSEIIDTVFIKFEETLRSPADFSTKYQFTPILTSNPVFKLDLNFNKPIIDITTDSIYLFLDSANIIRFNEGNFDWGKHHDKLSIRYELDPTLFVTEKPNNATASERYANPTSAQQKKSSNDTTKKTPPKPTIKPHFYAGISSFISVENDSSDQIKKDLNFVKPDQLGTILIEVHTDNPSFFIQLLDNQNNVKDEKYNQTNFKFSNVPPGDYRLRVLIDANKNGIWEPGNILLNDEPEPVIFYESSDGNEKLTIRANWELGPNVITF